MRRYITLNFFYKLVCLVFQLEGRLWSYASLGTGGPLSTTTGPWQGTPQKKPPWERKPPTQGSVLQARGPSVGATRVGVRISLSR